jgi:Tol biopolymer transport system component/C-terminal processing protease CtpA/Prc
MRRFFLRASVLLAAALPLGAAFEPARAQAPSAAPPPTADARPSFYDPAISPDRSEIAFVSGGDIWTVPAAGGDARLLVSHAATESRPLYSPDGRKLAFVSTRTGNGDIYVLTLATGALRRLTFDDALDQLDAWSPDGRWLYFTSSRGDIGGMNDVWRVGADGGTPMPVASDRYTNEFWSAPSPDGQALAITARGTVTGQWWRRGHSHLDESEIWLVRDFDRPRYEAVTTGGAKDAWPMWGPDGSTLYFVRDDHGVENVWARGADGQTRTVTRFTGGRVLWPNISADGRAIVFERDLTVWILDPASGEAHEVPVALRGAPATPGVEHLRVSEGLNELALSPDGKKVAFLVRGEVFAASAKDGGDAERVTRTTAREQELAWLPDSRQLLYVSSRAGYPQLFVYDFSTGTETALTNDPRGDVNPRVSPDGKSVAFARGGRDLAVVDVASQRVRTLATGFFDRLPFTSAQGIAWSPDNRWVAFLSAGASMFNTVYVVPAAGGESLAASFLPDVFGNALSWSPDGKYLLFDTSQRTESPQLARIDLLPRTPLFREEQFRELFRQPARPATAPTPEPRPAQPAAPPSPPARERARPRDVAASSDTSTARPRADSAARTAPVEIVFDDIRRRLSFLPVGVDLNTAIIAPDGKSVLLVASAAGQQNLYTYSLDELSREDPVARQLTSTAGGKSSAQWSPDGKEVWFLQNGRINVITVEGRATRQVAVTAELDVDFDAQKLVMFDEAYRFLRDGFHDSTMNGADWDGVHARYAPWAAGARTPDEERRIIALMIGELNASHCGVSAPGSAATPPYVGRLGLDFDRTEYERNGRMKITNVVFLGPAAVAGGIAAGDHLLAVEGARLDGHTNLDSVLSYTIGRQVTLSVAHGADGANPRDVNVKPVNLATERGLRYRQWVEERRAYVARVSSGRLGYVHMVDMGSGSLQQLFVDLDSENRGRDGVVIDVRHNNGGFVNAYAIDVFARRGYLTMTYRGAPVSAPARTVLGQRALERPTILVTDQHSLSDAEDFTEGYRALGLGKVVGEPTAGWIIYTSSGTLIDGSAVRMPFITVRGSDGQVMEMRPRPVDVAVERPVGESYTGRDSQLDAAVRELLAQIGAR